MSAVNLEKIDEKLSAQGWFLSSEGLEQITQNGNLKDLRVITQNALDTDLKEIGKAVLAEQLGRKLVHNVVLQIQKTRNISAPKANEDSQAAPRMLKLNLSDGHSYCQAIEIDNIGGLNLHKTAPGTKLLLQNAPVLNGYLFLKPEMAIVLGGKVAHMYEKWEVNRNMSNVKRGDSDADGPPAWVNFGRKIAGSETKDFKSLEDKIPRDEGKNSEFDLQRNVAIAEATTGAVKKVFGGGTKPLMKEVVDGYGNRREPREGRDFREPREPREPREFRDRERDRDRDSRETREPRDRNNKPERRNKREPRVGKDDVLLAKPSDKVSLFDFLEDKLPEMSQVTQSAPAPQKTYNNYNQGQRGGMNRAPQYEKYDRYERQDKFDKPYNSYNNQKPSNHYQNDYNKSSSYPAPSYQNDYKSSSANYPRDNRDNRRGNQPPRMQNKPQHYNQQYQQFPPSQNFYNPPNNAQNAQNSSSTGNVDELANKIDRLNVNASFAKNAFKQHLNLPNQTPVFAPVPVPAPTTVNKGNNEGNYRSKTPDFTNALSTASTGEWKWHIGDLCMAKYWEDNKYYNATITGLTAKTCVVRFNEYGNMEEVLLEDCLPVSSEDQAESTRKGGNNKMSNGNEYRGNRNFVNRNRRH